MPHAATSSDLTAEPPSALRQALAPRMVRRSLIVAAVVGTVLNAINQGDAIVYGGPVDLLKVCLTFCVPFCVSTYGAWSAFRSR